MSIPLYEYSWKAISQSVDFAFMKSFIDCPHCHCSSTPICLIGILKTVSLQTQWTFLFTCGRSNCKKSYLWYIISRTEELKYQTSDKLKFVWWIKPKLPTFIRDSTYIRNLSPSFVKIYYQSLVAETQNLLLICWAWYRKAFEFLIKDYLKNTTTVANIEWQSLNSCIKHIWDSTVQEIAHKTSWLWNDEVHYIRKHTNKDIKDFKTFIEYFIRFIDKENYYETEIKSLESK
jgi:hypothetical protein